MKDRYDVIVVGGGPGGSWAAKHAAEGGASVLLLEKDREIGIPVRCAEGLSELGLKRVVEVKDHWISQVIRGTRLVAPDGTVIESFAEGIGFVLNRKLFDYGLAAMASQAGADVLTKAYVHGLCMVDGVVNGVKMTHMGQKHRISSSVVIGADGVESRVGRWVGLETRIHPEEMESCVQMTLTDIDIDPGVVEFYFGRQVAPGGYLWIFPKGSRTANVGLGISGVYSRVKKPLFYLQEFVERKFPGASVLTMVAGGVPTVPTLKKIVRDGLMLVGDAARQANPMTGGGILCAMIAGKIAGRVVADAVRAGDVSAKRLGTYPREWHKTEGKKNERIYRIKTVVDRFSDEDLNRTAQMLLSIPPEERTALQIFKKALFNHPKLILEAAKVFSRGKD